MNATTNRKTQRVEMEIATKKRCEAPNNQWVDKLRYAYAPPRCRGLYIWTGLVVSRMVCVGQTLMAARLPAPIPNMNSDHVALRHHLRVAI